MSFAAAVAEHLRCPICLEVPRGARHDGAVWAVRDCQHAFCRACLERALRYAHACPVCKGAVSSMRGAAPSPALSAIAREWREAFGDDDDADSKCSKPPRWRCRSCGGRKHAKSLRCGVACVVG